MAKVTRFYMLHVILLGCLSWGGCVTLAEKGGRALDGTLFAEKTEAVYRVEPKRGLQVRQARAKNGEAYLVITVDELPTLRLYGALPGPDGGFSLHSYSFLASNYTGWNEFNRELSGGGIFQPDGEGAILRLDEGLEVLDIREGGIRRANTRLYGAQALTSLRNREERIDALTGWMRGLGEQERFPDQKGFEDHWLGILFPEAVSPKKRPPGWDQGETERVTGEDVQWNAGYTRRVFPEELWAARNSGSLLRDWEEAAAWLYLQFEWDSIIASLTRETRLIKIK